MIKRVLIISLFLLYLPYSLYSQDTNEEPAKSVFTIFKGKAVFDSMTTGPMFWKDIITAGKIELLNCNECRVTGFDLRVIAYTIYNSDSCCAAPKLSGTFHSDSAGLTPKMLKAISKAKQGRLNFYNISASTPAGQEIDLNTIVLYMYPTKTFYKRKFVTYKD